MASLNPTFLRLARLHAGLVPIDELAGWSLYVFVGESLLCVPYQGLYCGSGTGYEAAWEAKHVGPASVVDSYDYDVQPSEYTTTHDVTVVRA